MSERRRSNMPSSPSSVAPESGRESRGMKFSELHEICAGGDVDKLDEILKSGRYEFLNYKDPDWGDRTPLHWCSLKGKGDMVRRLIDKGAHPGLRSDCGWTAAHFAAEGGKTHVLRTLHSLNSPMNRRDLYGDTPRRIAEVYGHKESVEFLRIAEEEYKDRRTNTELNGEAEPFDDEDMEWCLKNSFEPDSYISADDMSTGRLTECRRKSFQRGRSNRRRSVANEMRKSIGKTKS
uniref:ankyrin repeat domain-containing protein 66-like isoform X2 n=1 Tax=Styela clava TaxID=7725 RepID=UPI001939D8FD|nr:ankyrin repeat domain-containing protein 66-like isoform X2 [Styela clava]XP_039271499.1 ankyrin repeat domain-containing protein 66-like isoform X2 [Styela clava]